MEASAITKIDVLDTEVSGLKVDVANLDKRMSTLGDKLDTGLGKLFDRLESQNSRGTPWSLIFGFGGIAVTVGLALSAWANAYFGQSIAQAQREASRALEVHSSMQQQIHAGDITAARLDERVKMQAEEMNRHRAEIDKMNERGQPPFRP